MARSKSSSNVFVRIDTLPDPTDFEPTVLRSVIDVCANKLRRYGAAAREDAFDFITKLPARERYSAERDRDEDKTWRKSTSKRQAGTGRGGRADKQTFLPLDSGGGERGTGGGICVLCVWRLDRVFLVHIRGRLSLQAMPTYLYHSRAHCVNECVRGDRRIHFLAAFLLLQALPLTEVGTSSRNCTLPAKSTASPRYCNQAPTSAHVRGTSTLPRKRLPYLSGSVCSPAFTFFPANTLSTGLAGSSALETSRGVARRYQRLQVRKAS